MRVKDDTSSFYYDDQIKEDTMGGACSTHEELRKE
jgi:hypothetical protein